MESKGDVMRKEKPIGAIHRKFLVVLVMVFTCIGMWGATPADGNGNFFSMVINKPKEPYFGVVIRDIGSGADGAPIGTINIDAGFSSLNQMFASVYVETNIEQPYELSMRCTPFIKMIGTTTSYLTYNLAIYNVTEDAPLPNSPFMVGENGLDSIPLMRTYQSDGSNEKIEVAWVALQLNNVDSAIPGDPYQATITFEVRSV